MIDKTVEWMRDRVKEAGAEGLLVGVSGGIDSAVVAFLIKKAFPNNSLGIILPCGSSKEDIEDAGEVVKACGIDTCTFNITPAHQSIVDAVLPELGRMYIIEDCNKRIATANLKARLRMSTLYTVANALNYLVVGTDNAAETYTGYFTKYGDGGVDILPISNLTKREVREWGRVLGVPEKIINRTPTAGLWEGQTDEGEMGTTYDMVDDYIKGKDIPYRDREVIERLHARSEHKRKLPPSPPAEWYR
jgi:NAD+ synthase